jgi:hypothetical protein
MRYQPDRRAQEWSWGPVGHPTAVYGCMSEIIRIAGFAPFEYHGWGTVASGPDGYCGI